MQEFEEKRTNPRMEIDCEIAYRPADSDNILTGRCSSISGDGISFIADSAYHPGIAMEVSLSPKNNAAPPMTAYIEVVRCVETGQGGYTVAGIIESIKAN